MSKIKQDFQSNIWIQQIAESIEPLVEAAKTQQAQIAKGLQPVTETIRSFQSMIEEARPAIEEFGKNFESYKDEYKGIYDQYNDYWRLNGIIRPKDIWELLCWLEDCVYPDKPLGYILYIGLQEFHFKQFHKYKALKFNQNWDNKKERQRMQTVLNSPQSTGIEGRDKRPNESERERTFKDCLVGCDKEAVMAKLEELISENTGGRIVAKTLEACQKKKYLVMYGYKIKMVRETFGLRTSRQSITNYLNKGKFTDQEIDEIAGMIP